MSIIIKKQINARKTKKWKKNCLKKHFFIQEYKKAWIRTQNWESLFRIHINIKPLIQIRIPTNTMRIRNTV